jgi:hypothetical protein
VSVLAAVSAYRQGLPSERTALHTKYLAKLDMRFYHIGQASFIHDGVFIIIIVFQHNTSATTVSSIICRFAADGEYQPTVFRL